jgi:hypothetical protein
MSKHTVLEPPYKGNNYDMQNLNLYSSLKMPDLIITAFSGTNNLPNYTHLMMNHLEFDSAVE